MGEFTARTALLTGVELIRRRPLLVLLWAALLLAQATVFAAATREVMATTFSGRRATQLLPLSAAEAVVSLVVASVLWSSAFRAILRPAERRPLAFGPEELSVLAVWFIIQIVVQIVSGALQILLISRFSGVMDVRQIVNLGAAVSVLGLFWSAVASVWTFGRGQISPFRCWTIAKGRFWLLAGLVIGVAVLDRLAGAEVRELATALGRVFPPARVSPLEPFGVAAPQVQDLVQIPLLLRNAVLAPIGALQIAFIAGIVACAYRASAPESQAATFSSAVSGPAS
jgi:hypothetical protein